MSDRTLWIQGDRQFGKTETLAYWVQEKPGRVIITHDKSEHDRLIRQYGLFPEQVAVFNTPALSTGSPRREYAVDNLDLVLRRALNIPGPLVAVTFSHPVHTILCQREVNNVHEVGDDGPRFLLP